MDGEGRRRTRLFGTASSWRRRGLGAKRSWSTGSAGPKSSFLLPTFARFCAQALWTSRLRVWVCLVGARFYCPAFSGLPAIPSPENCVLPQSGWGPLPKPLLYFVTSRFSLAVQRGETLLRWLDSTGILHVKGPKQRCFHWQEERSEYQVVP